jgi:hypothetical protein
LFDGQGGAPTRQAPGLGEHNAELLGPAAVPAVVKAPA